ncbi:MAG: hypothetical protein ACE5FU_13060 [Nitrospinota bacterium]
MRDTLSYCIDRKLEFRENLTKSILALEKFDPLIAKYLGSQPVERCWKRLVLSLDSNFTTKVQIKGGFNYANSAYSPWSEARCQLSAIGALKEKDVLHYFGIGLGYHLLLLLQQNNALNLTLYEYDANWLIQAFSIHDFSGFFSSHSIKIFLNQVRDVSTPVSKSKNDIVWVNPVIGKAYDSYYSKILGSGVNIESGNQDVAVVIPLHSDPAYKNLSKKVSEELSRRNWTVEECGNGLHEIKVQCFKTRPQVSILSLIFSRTVRYFQKYESSLCLLGC